MEIIAQEHTAKGQEYRAQEAGTVAAKKETQKPFTVSALLREEFDDNIYTTRLEKEAQFKTIIEPSMGYNYLLDQTLFSMRYTYGMTYFMDRPEKEIDSSHEFVGRVNHSFSSRFNVDFRERFRYSQEPQILEGSARSRRSNGSYYSNVGTMAGNMQWTPKLGTVSSYSHDFLDYQERVQSGNSDRTVHTLSHDFRYLILPTTTLVFGGIGSVNDYVYAKRDSLTAVANFGVDHAVTPQVTIGGRTGPSWTKFFDGGDYVSPYGMMFVGWELGARSRLDASYTHTISETDLDGYYGQETDTLSLTGKYNWTPNLYNRIGTRYKQGHFESDLGVGSVSTNYREDVLGFSLTTGYKINTHMDVELSYNYDRVDSDDLTREYDRNRISLGLRGTY